jgi:predicted phage tail protein
LVSIRTSRARRVLAGTGLVLVGVVLLVAPASAQAPGQAKPDIEPIVECSFLDPGTGLYNTVWGYKNNGAKDESLPVGATNSFDNPGANAGQPTVFKKGRAQSAFIVTHKGSSTWTLSGRAVTAPGAACRTNPVPVVGEGAGGLITIIVVTVVLGLCAFIRFRPRRA